LPGCGRLLGQRDRDNDLYSDDSIHPTKQPPRTRASTRSRNRSVSKNRRSTRSATCSGPSGPGSRRAGNECRGGATPPRQRPSGVRTRDAPFYATSRTPA
jgi:hypothetical protein